MNSLVIFVLCAVAVAEAGILPYYLTHTNPIYYPSLGKIVQYPVKPVYGYSAKIIQPLPQFPVYQPLVKVHTPIAAPVHYIPSVNLLPPPASVVARADAATSAGVVSSRAVSHAGSLNPISVVASSVPGAAYTTAIIHPDRPGSPNSAGTHASIFGGS